MKRALAALSLAALLLGCASGAETKPAQSGAEKEKSESSSGAAEEKSKLEAEHARMIQECVEQPELAGFCECGYDFVVQRSTWEERQQGNSPKMLQLRDEVPMACGSTLPPKFQNDLFLAQCASDAGLVPFCQCRYDFLAPRGLAFAPDERVAPVVPELDKACIEPLYAYARPKMIAGCSQQSGEKACECLFQTLEARFGRLGMIQNFDPNSPNHASMVETSRLEMQRCAKENPPK